MTKEEQAIEDLVHFLEPKTAFLKPKSLAETITDLSEAGETLSPSEHEYLCGKGARRRGPKRFSQARRDNYIAEAVFLTIRRGFRPTRNRATARKEGAESACSIVVAALQRVKCGTLTEEAIEKIWQKKAPKYFREELPVFGLFEDDAPPSKE